jgi:hypothetical protein
MEKVMIFLTRIQRREILKNQSKKMKYFPLELEDRERKNNKNLEKKKKLKSPLVHQEKERLLKKKRQHQ